MNRRTVLKSLAVLTAAGALPIPSAFAEAKKYGFKQSACLWCYNGWMSKNNVSLDQFCEAAAKIGIQSLELTGEGQWETMKKYGLCCAMIGAPMGITRGFNHTQYHEELIVKTKECVDKAVKWGFPNVITMSGNCEGMGKEEGLANCIKGLKEVVPYAEKNGIVLCMELLNSHGHKDYMCDEAKWAVDLVHAIDSPSFKILYDIYHAREMGEDPIKDIREHHDCWGHYH
ncbi:MAG: sugar phosphate isomerase/epimerase, partial [Thermoguttaceae bacterium]|nr:sugar phosphate isomerase/epimerase [Thermoguttaceae bacterium]